MVKIVITTGGTGGHIYPALSVAKEFQKRGHEVTFVGSSSRMEKDLVPKSGINFIGLNIKPGKSIKNIISIFFLILHCIKYIKRENPDVIIGFGNYISFPMVCAAFIKRKKIYLQEQNANIGMTNKFFYRFAEKVFLAFNHTFEELPMKFQYKFKVTGNPLREEIYKIDKKEEREKLKVSSEEKILVITGGSLGAKSINEAIAKYWDELENKKGLRIYWATGTKNYEDILKNLEIKNVNHVVKPYFDNLINVMGAADLIICRAGALTISEIIQLEKPAILIPYNSVKVGQYENAMILKEAGGALIYNDKEVDEAIETALEILENENILHKMGNNIKNLKINNATKAIVDTIEIWRNN
ncbi:undecaprenyldiphospho-muramoylpentapeptide beta-N-acetylglucosaminyltransferase [Fusobacterium perfoetens]|uniref:undecaprenyldiphospho-muramoylpentapeptide beta-N-acetylglucosaminyltransferase n=1 Tax=Fusobacterium TaxID=848 RepID=UPI0014772695|nr:undecaprenyldiphospho-muramoylpentapeptide beta-N-acetylglucosaminyltransferase [Fusobacterium perfoetens]NME35999.1 undecaprenyldiphospho-muramoylpentapeptide beta-N-acetylglucosaminyltransferase [Fusobacterium sp. FSA-380-WT-3A]